MQRSGPWTLRRYCVQLGHAVPCGPARSSWQPLRGFSAVPSLRKKSGSKKSETSILGREDEGSGINYFEQVAPGPEGVRPISKAKFEGKDVAQDIKARIQKLEEQLRELDSDEAVDQLSATENELLKNAGDIGGLTKDRDADGTSNTGIHELFTGVTPKNLELDFHLPEDYERELHQLSNLLHKVAADPSITRQRRLLWQQYILCKNKLPGVQEQLPDGAWRVLWQSQYATGLQDETRARHLWTLLEDMTQYGRDLSPVQKMVYIEYRVAANRHSAALEMWNKWREELQGNEDLAEPFLDLGPRLQAAVGNTLKAQALALEIARSRPPRVNTFIPVLDAWLRQGDQEGQEKAWALYIRVREITHDTITLEDYDKLSMCFLSNHQMELAVAVFKDLVLSGRNSQHDSRAMYRKSLSMYDRLQRHTVDPESLNEISLMSLAVLPRSFQNKFFYASWMKRLIGLGEIDAAASILQLMYDRGVRPDPKHINGLIGAWFRRNRGSDRKIALKVCWAMIKKRLEFVALRRAMESDLPVPLIPEDPSTRIPPYLGNSLPPATVETFSLLLLYYERASMHSSIEILNDALTAAELRPNSYYLTHLLYGHIRRGSLESLWNLFLSSTSDLAPELSTYACLWDAEKAHISAFGASRTQKFPGPRTLLKHTLNWHASLTPRARAQVQEEFSPELYTQIIRCFSLTRDLPGTLIALYALRDTFHAFPTANDVRIVTVQLARTGEPHDFGWKRRRRSRFGDNLQSQAAMTKVAEVLDLVAKERDKVLADAGVGKDEMNKEMRGEEGLWVLGSFLRTVLESQARARREGTTERVDIEVVDTEVEKIAWGMDAGGLRMGSPVYKRGLGGLEMDGYEGHELREFVEEGGGVEEA